MEQFLEGQFAEKKTYAEATKEAFMQETDDGAGDVDIAGQSETKTNDDTQSRKDVKEPMEVDCLTDDAWEITASTELKCKMAGPWQTSVILKLMGKQLGYRALQTRLAGIWRRTSNMNLIDVGYGFLS